MKINSSYIKDKALELGFSFCGIAKAEELRTEAQNLEKWLAKGKHGKMAYMENYFDMRIDPRKLVPGAKSVISLLFNYFPSETQNPDSVYKISKYAYGRDYHKVIKSKLKKLLTEIREETGDVQGRGFVDSAPVLDKVWAQKSGLGWIGKNSNLINKGNGSFFFIANLIIDLELEYDSPVNDYCGTCTRCIDACPTNAIEIPYVVNGSKCISYLTIELKEKIPAEHKETYAEWIFGCDICQDVCPWNRFSTPNSEPDFNLKPELKTWNKKDWEEITEDIFEQVFSGSPLKRAGFEKLKNNISFVQKK
jgi:epoxyqueuosine reductase